MLKLELIQLGESLRALEIGWLTFLDELDFFTERIGQPALDQIDREIGDINADHPTATSRPSLLFVPPPTPPRLCAAKTTPPVTSWPKSTSYQLKAPPYLKSLCGAYN